MMLAKIKTLKIIRFKKSGRQRCVVSVLRIIACIHEKFPQTDVENLGETDIIVTLRIRRCRLWHGIS